MGYQANFHIAHPPLSEHSIDAAIEDIEKNSICYWSYSERAMFEVAKKPGVGLMMVENP
jgi:hypothetical protein